MCSTFKKMLSTSSPQFFLTPILIKFILTQKLILIKILLFHLSPTFLLFLYLIQKKSPFKSETFPLMEPSPLSS